MKKYVLELKKNILNMKKHTLLIIVGGILLLTGFLLYNNHKPQTIYYYDSKLTQDEAKALIIDKTKTIMDLYEKVDDSFKIEKKEISDEEQKEDPNLYVKVSNYDNVIDEIYSEKGKIELESIKFNQKSFIEKKEDGIYILSKIPNDNSYLDSSIVVDNIRIKEDEIKALVSFESDKIDKDNITYNIYEKDITLVKIDDKWLVDTFIYSNV